MDKEENKIIVFFLKKINGQSLGEKKKKICKVQEGVASGERQPGDAITRLASLLSISPRAEIKRS